MQNDIWMAKTMPIVKKNHQGKKVLKMLAQKQKGLTMALQTEGYSKHQVASISKNFKMARSSSRHWGQPKYRLAEG